MARAIDVVTAALKLIGVQPAESPVESSESDDGLTSLNDMMAEWELDGITIGYEALDDIQDELYVDDSALSAIKSNLAVYIAPEYMRIVTPALEVRARNSKKALRASIPLNPLQFPDSLAVGSGNESGNYAVDGDVAGGSSNLFYPANSNPKCN